MLLQWDKQKSSLSRAYRLVSLVSRDFLTMPGPRSLQVPLSAGRYHLKSHFSCAVVLHLAGSTMRYLWSLGGCVCCWPVSRAIVIPGWQQFCLIHEQAMWYECMWHGRCSQQCNLKQHSWWHSDFFIISMLFFPPLKPKKLWRWVFNFFSFPKLSAFLECPGVILLVT